LPRLFVVLHSSACALINDGALFHLHKLLFVTTTL
jgi:hypothetical protein